MNDLCITHRAPQQQPHHTRTKQHTEQQYSLIETEESTTDWTSSMNHAMHHTESAHHINGTVHAEQYTE